MSPAIPTDIICGVDFSDESARALTWAQLLVTRLGARLVVVTVVDPLLAGAARTQTDSGWFLNDGRRDLEAFVTRAIGQPAATAAELLVVVGAPVLALLHAAEQHGAIIVIGTRGLGRAERMIFGSTTLRLMRTTTWPVLAVPHAAADQRPWAGGGATGHRPAHLRRRLQRVLEGRGARGAYARPGVVGARGDRACRPDGRAACGVGCDFVADGTRTGCGRLVSARCRRLVARHPAGAQGRPSRTTRRRPAGRRRGATVAHRPRPWRRARPSAGHDGHARHRRKPCAGPDRSSRRVLTTVRTATTSASAES